MTQARPTVSFVVTVFNKAPYLPQVLDAIAAQRGAFAGECVFVDDGSTDDSLAILRERTSGWPDTIIVTQANAGPARASNAALRLARGAFVKFVDGDDVLAPEATQHLVDLAERHQADLAYGAGAHYDPGQPPPAGADADDAGWLHPDPLGFVLTSPPFNLSQVLVRRAAAEAVGGFDERLFVQDYPFLLRLAERHRFAGTRATVCYFPRQTQKGSARLTDDHANMLFHANLTLWLFCREHDLPPERLGLAAQRCVGRSWLYARRHRGRGVLSREYVRFVLDRMLPARDRDTALRRIRQSLGSFGAAPARRYAALLGAR
ncbi:MAG: glycosyltransferase family 2 protein [Alphaproteobacteria bacterium]|nr:glycosyltransferase family 2 protein [Alphaproteobacteria bacterium]